MTNPAATQPISRPVLAVAATFGALAVAAAALWGYYGTAVFFEMVRTGFVACF
jgi:hypothetical protein